MAVALPRVHRRSCHPTMARTFSKKGDVVVVSINHRLNILGYLDLSAYGDKYKHSANISILDIKSGARMGEGKYCQLWRRP